MRHHSKHGKNFNFTVNRKAAPSKELTKYNLFSALKRNQIYFKH